ARLLATGDGRGCYRGRAWRSARWGPLAARELHTDTGYDYAFCREARRERGNTPRNARRRIRDRGRPGQHRRKDERALSSLRGRRTSQTRSEQRDETLQVFLSLS